MRDSVCRTLIGFILAQVVFVLLQGLVIATSLRGLDFDVWLIAIDAKRRLVAEAQAVTVVLFTVAVCLQRMLHLVRPAIVVPLIGLALTAGPFWYDTRGAAPAEIASRGVAFVITYVVLGLLLGALYWLLVVVERPGESDEPEPVRAGRSRRS